MGIVLSFKYEVDFPHIHQEFVSVIFVQAIADFQVLLVVKPPHSQEEVLVGISDVLHIVCQLVHQLRLLCHFFVTNKRQLRSQPQQFFRQIVLEAAVFLPVSHALDGCESDIVTYCSVKGIIFKVLKGFYNVRVSLC